MKFVKGVGLVGEVERYEPCKDHVIEILLEGKCKDCGRKISLVPTKPEDFIIHEGESKEE